LIGTAANGAQLIVFPEAFIPGYPAWIWRLRPGGDWDTSETLHARLLNNAVTVNSDELRPLLDAARTHQVTVVCGLNEKGRTDGNTTFYNSVIVISHQGEIINHHRKLMPTNPERMVWGFGDATGLKVVDTPIGRIGSLICWENYMPLSRYTFYTQGIDIYIAPTYDSGDGWTGTLQHIAREGRCWVVGSGVVIEHSDIPEDFPDRDQLYPDTEKWINPGDSVVIAPRGDIVAGPMHQEKGILYADIDTSMAGVARRDLDVAGHYARPDIFTLQIDTSPQAPASLNPNKPEYAQQNADTRSNRFRSSGCTGRGTRRLWR
jgi:nitrilase